MASVVVDSAAAPPDAQFVARSFVNRYYNVLLNNPAYAYKFYDDSSVVSWPGSDSKSLVTVTTMEKIQELIMSQDYEGCQAMVETIDGQPSQSGGIVVVVTGTWKGKETSRSFSETFFLANKQGRGPYYVLNNVFRFVDHPVAADAASSVPTDGDMVVSATPKGDQAVVSPPTAVVSKAEAEAETHPKTTTQQEVVDKVETLAEKLSYANIAEKKAAANSGATSHRVVVVAANSGANQVAAAHKVVVPASISKPKNDNNNNNKNNNGSSPSLSLSPQDNGVDVNSSKSVALNNNNNKKEKTAEELEQEAKDREARTIYIGLPFGASVYEVRDVVKRSFGRIAKGGVRVGWEDYKRYRYWYAFVEFESAASASYAIRMGKLFFGQREAYVTQRGLPGFPNPQQVVQKKNKNKNVR